MRIAQLAPLWKTVPPEKYGGTEFVISTLTEALVNEGHDVTLFACGGSKTAGKLIQVIDRPLFDLLGGFFWDAIPAQEFLLYDELFRRLNEFDIIHNHVGMHPLVFAKLIRIPTVTTIHSSVAPDFPFFLERLKDEPIVSISNAQRKLSPNLNYVATIYHGINTVDFKPRYEQGEYFLFLGSLTKNKGVDIAVKAAHELNERLIIAGSIFGPEDQEFLDREVMPYVDGDRAKFLGEVDFQTKRELYAKARALLFPTQWNEAFGLVMIEALASGTPVIAYNRGAVSEVITNGVTGFVVETFQEFKEGIKKYPELSRRVCRQEAESRFDAKIMAKNYVELYSKLVGEGSAG